MKQCSKCKEHKPLTEFHNCKRAPLGKAYYCKACAIDNAKRHHTRRIKDDVVYQRQKRSAYFKSKYGITLDDYERLLEEQGNRCAICSITLKPQGIHTHLDHNHSTGKIRAFLCTNCNRGLGHFQDSWQLLSNAMNYLERHET